MLITFSLLFRHLCCAFCIFFSRYIQICCFIHSLSKNNISDEGAKGLANALRVNVILHTLKWDKEMEIRCLKDIYGFSPQFRSDLQVPFFFSNDLKIYPLQSFLHQLLRRGSQSPGGRLVHQHHSHRVGVSLKQFCNLAGYNCPYICLVRYFCLLLLSQLPQVLLNHCTCSWLWFPSPLAHLFTPLACLATPLASRARMILRTCCVPIPRSRRWGEAVLLEVQGTGGQ